MNHTGAFRALARYLDREVTDRCTAHGPCVLRAGHTGPPRRPRSDHTPALPGDGTFGPEVTR